MGGRYLVTEVQLAMIMANTKELDTKKMIAEIMDCQYVKYSENTIIDDCEKVRELFIENK